MIRDFSSPDYSFSTMDIHPCADFHNKFREMEGGCLYGIVPSVGRSLFSIGECAFGIFGGSLAFLFENCCYSRTDYKYTHTKRFCRYASEGSLSLSESIMNIATLTLFQGKCNEILRYGTTVPALGSLESHDVVCDACCTCCQGGIYINEVVPQQWDSVHKEFRKYEAICLCGVIPSAFRFAFSIGQIGLGTIGMCACPISCIGNKKGERDLENHRFRVLNGCCLEGCCGFWEALVNTITLGCYQDFNYSGPFTRFQLCGSMYDYASDNLSSAPPRIQEMTDQGSNQAASNSGTVIIHTAKADKAASNQKTIVHQATASNATGL